MFNLDVFPAFILCGREVKKKKKSVFAVVLVLVGDRMFSINVFFVVVYFQEVTVPSAESLHILDFHFSDFGLPEDLTTQATIRMFLDLNLVQDFKIDYKVTDLLIFPKERSSTVVYGKGKRFHF